MPEPKVIIDEPGIYRTANGKMALVFRYQDHNFVCIINGIMNGYSYDKYGKCAVREYEFSIKEKIKGMDLYVIFNKVFGSKA